MDDLPQSDVQSVMQVQQENESGLLQSYPAPCETDETKEGKGIDGKRKLKQKCMSNPQVQLKKLATEVSHPKHKHNGDVDSLGVEESSCSPLKQSPKTESSRIPTTVEAAEESLSNCETKLQESKSDGKITQKNVNNSETTQRTVNNSETTVPKILNNFEKVSESESNCEVSLQKDVSNCESEIQGTTSNSETSQQSISKCETKKEVVSNSETAEERVSNCDLSSGKPHEEDKQSLKNETSEPRVVLTRVSTVDDEPSSDKILSEWGSRLRVRRAPPPPPSPPEKEYPPPKREKTVTRTVALKKVNYCELYSSEDELSVPSVPKKGKSTRKSHRRSSSSSEFGMSDDDYSSDDSRLRRKKRAALKKKEQESNSDGSDADYGPKKYGRKSKKIHKGNVKFSKKEENLSEYEQLQRKNIEEKLAFLKSLNFNEMEEEFSKSKS